MSSAIVIGGGVVGLATALHLRLEGWEVTVIERENRREGCSYVNAGMIVPSHFVPLAAPGVVADGVRWMLRAESPFAIAFRSLVADLGWLLLFQRNANAENVRRAARPLLDLHVESRRIYLEWSKTLGVPVHTKGILMLYRSPEGERHERETAEMARRIGLEPLVMGPDQIAELDPAARYAVRGGVHYPLDGHLDPGRLMQALHETLEERDVTILRGHEVRGIRLEGDRVGSVQTSLGDHRADEYVVCAGVWSAGLLRRLGVRLPLLGGKGYSFDVPNPGMSVPALLSEARVAITPMGAALRIGGTMEIGGSPSTVRAAKLLGIRRSFEEYLQLPLPPREGLPVRSGLRPLSPDGLPYLGRLRRARNLSVAAGHAMMGVSLAAASGAAIAQLLHRGRSEVDLSAFDPNRFA